MYKDLFIGFVVNYYCRDTYNEVVRASAKLAVSMLSYCSIIDRIVLIDGSPLSDSGIREHCTTYNVDYVHLGRELEFAEAFNVGWQKLDTEIVGLMASDVFPSNDTITSLVDVLTRPGVGCVAPYLDYCDYPGQVVAFVRNPVSCEPTSMSLNLNLYTKDVLEAIGGIDEHYSGGYNDLVMLIKIRKIGQKVMLVGNTRTAHLGRTTVSQGSNFNMEKDIPRFSSEFPEYYAQNGYWNIAHWKWPFATTKRAKVFWWIAQNFPNHRIRKLLEKLTMWLEPDLTRIDN